MAFFGQTSFDLGPKRAASIEICDYYSKNLDLNLQQACLFNVIKSLISFINHATYQFLFSDPRGPDVEMAFFGQTSFDLGTVIWIVQ